MIALSQAKGVWGDNKGKSEGFTLHHLSVIALTVATAYEDEQFPCEIIYLAQSGCDYLKLYDSGTIVSLFPVEHL